MASSDKKRRAGAAAATILRADDDDDDEVDALRERRTDGGQRMIGRGWGVGRDGGACLSYTPSMVVQIGQNIV